MAKKKIKYISEEDVDSQLQLVCNIFGAIRKKSAGDRQVFPSSFGIGMFAVVVNKDITPMEVVGLAVEYGQIMAN